MALTVIGLSYLEERKAAYLKRQGTIINEIESVKPSASVEYMRGYVGGNERVSVDDVDHGIVRTMNGW